MNKVHALNTRGCLAAMLGILVAGTVAAQSADTSTTPPTQAPAPAATETPLLLDAYITTASVGGKVTELNAAMDVSIVSHQDIVTTPAAGPAGLLDSVPGFYGQSSGGEVNQNLTVDGLATSFYTFISLQEDGLPVQYSGFFPEFQIRPDSTYGSVEVIRNGPSTIYAPQAAAATANFITRIPTVDEGDATLSFTSEGNKRLDFFYGGPVPGFAGWSAGVGGYYETGQGERPVGYTVTKGGQVRAFLKKEFQGGSLTITYKNINAHVPFYVDVPFYEDNSGHLHAVPGFDPKVDTLYSPELQNGTLHPPVGQGTNRSLDEGNGNSDTNQQLDAKFEKDFGNGISVMNNFRISHFSYTDDDDRAGGNGNLSTAGAFLASNLPTLQAYGAGLPGSPAVVSDALVQVATGKTITNTAGLNGNGLLLDDTNFQYGATFDTIMDDFRVSWKTDKNSLDVGLLYMQVNGSNIYETGNDELIDITNHAHLYDVVGLNAQGGVVDHLTDNGVTTFDSIGAGYYGNGNEDVTSTNYYINDQYQLTKELRIDAGFRYEQTNYQTLAENDVYGAALPMAAANPTIIADQTDGSYGNGTYASGSNGGNDSAWTAGANYLITPRFSVFARTTKSFDEGVQDFNVFGGQNGNPSRSSFQTLHSDQAGVRYENPWFAFSVTGFYAEYNHYAIAVTPASGGPQSNIFINFQSTGADFETVWRPMHAFELKVSGVVQHAEDVDIPSGLLTTNGVVNGDQPARMPDVQIRAQPTVYFDQPGAEYFAHSSAYLLATYYGQRYGDVANTQVFDSYTNWGAGISTNITKWLTLDVVGDNLGNALGLTEGNPRGGSNLSTRAGYVLARPIWGRNVKVSVTYHF
jgi:outer membrane receptor protein involved in Fe transport